MIFFFNAFKNWEPAVGAVEANNYTDASKMCSVKSNGLQVLFDDRRNLRQVFTLLLFSSLLDQSTLKAALTDGLETVVV